MENKCLLLLLSVFGVMIYGAYGLPAEATEWIENFTSADIVSNNDYN